jgi:hypothetical protein
MKICVIDGHAEGFQDLLEKSMGSISDPANRVKGKPAAN